MLLQLRDKDLSIIEKERKEKVNKKERIRNKRENI